MKLELNGGEINDNGFIINWTEENHCKLWRPIWTNIIYLVVQIYK